MRDSSDPIKRKSPLPLTTRAKFFFQQLIGIPVDLADPTLTGQPSAAEFDASLKTDEERAIRARLVQSIEDAALFQGKKIGPDKRPLLDESSLQGKHDTVHVTEEEEYLIGPEIRYNMINRGTVMLVMPAYKLTIFLGGRGEEAKSDAKAITEGFDVIQENVLGTVVRIREAKEIGILTQRARLRGHRMTIMCTRLKKEEIKTVAERGIARRAAEAEKE